MNRQPETVVLVHGLWFNGWIMRMLARRLRRDGFDVHIFSYPTVSCDLRENAYALHRFIARLSPPVLHLVGYSLGGLVIRALFQHFPHQPPGRVVTLGTPHTGSAIAERFARHPRFRRWLGRGIGQLLSGACGPWPLPAREVGLIAGTVRFGAGLWVGGFTEPNDGTVAVNESFMPGGKDYLTLRVSHMGFVVSPAVARQVAHFLRHGEFAR